MPSSPAPPARPRAPVAPRTAGFAVSLLLHAGLLAAAASLQTGAAAGIAQAPERPLALAWTVTTSTDPVPPILPPRTAATSRAPEPVLEVISTTESDAEAARTPEVVTSLVREPPRPAAAEPLSARRHRDAVLSLRPGCGGTSGPGTGAGVLGSVGLGGAGGGDGSAAGTGGSSAGAGRGPGDEGQGTGIAVSGGVTRAAAVVGTPLPPAYPAKARSRGWEGRVVLEIGIDAQGGVTSVAVAETSGRAALDEAACDAARGWSFAPALRDGRPVAGSLRVPVRFELTD